MGLQGLDEFGEALIALPDRLDTRFAVPRAGSEATELGQAPHRLAERGRGLWRGAVMRHGINGVPLSGFKHYFARHLGIGTTNHGDTVDAPGHNEIKRDGVQQPLLSLQASLLDLASLLEHPKKEFYLPPTPIPLHHCTGTGEIHHRQTCEQEAFNRLLAAGG
jgi:hypothetical protein